MEMAITEKESLPGCSVCSAPETAAARIKQKLNADGSNESNGDCPESRASLVTNRNYAKNYLFAFYCDDCRVGRIGGG